MRAMIWRQQRTAFSAAEAGGATRPGTPRLPLPNYCPLPELLPLMPPDEPLDPPLDSPFEPLDEPLEPLLP